jgi:hypothetical protein
MYPMAAEWSSQSNYWYFIYVTGYISYKMRSNVKENVNTGCRQGTDNNTKVEKKNALANDKKNN